MLLSQVRVVWCDAELRHIRYEFLGKVHEGLLRTICCFNLDESIESIVRARSSSDYCISVLAEM